jgi:hypothetical protein
MSDNGFGGASYEQLAFECDTRRGGAENSSRARNPWRVRCLLREACGLRGT